MSRSNPFSAFAYSASLAGLAVAVLLRWLLDPVLGDTFPLVIVFAAIGFAIWIGGYGPSLLVVVLGYLACAYLFIEPRGQFGTSKLDNLVGLLLYLATAAVIVVFGEALRRSRPSHRSGTVSALRPAELRDEAEQRTTQEQIAKTLESATKRAEQEVVRIAAESERQRRLYETVLTNTPDFVYVFSLDHKVLYANDALIKMWGRGHEGAIGKTFLEIGYEPWHAEMHDREIDQVRATRMPVRGEVPFHGTHGLRQYDYIFVPVIGADGEVEAVAGTTRDVTDRKETEKQLRESEERQTFLVELADTLRPLADPMAVQAEASRVLGEWLGANRVAYFEVQNDEYVVERDYTVAALSMVGRYPVASFGPDLLAAYRAGRTASDPDVNASASRTAQERDAFAAVQIRAYVGVPLVKAGVFVAGLAVHSAQARAWTPTEIAIIEDTAERTWAAVERVRAEEALRLSEERFRTLFESMEEGFCVIEMEFDGSGRPTDYRIEVMNPAFEKHTGMRGLIGKSIRQAIPALEEFWYETYGRVASTGEPAQFINQAAPMGGRWFEVSAFRLGGPGSHKVAILFNDVSDRKAAEVERDQLVSQLRDQDRRKDEFLATLAHELRNPLAPIHNGLQLMKLTGVDGTLEQVRAIMERQLTQLIRLVDDLLDASRVTSGKLALRRERVDLKAIIDAAVETSRPVIEQAGHEFVVSLPDEPIIVDGDVTRLAQVISNLLNNSAKYTPPGGSIQLGARREGEMAVVEVTDDGSGIPHDMVGEVFEMFAQVDRTLEKTTGGLGIGLSLAKGLVELHGGTIEARSEGVGQGSEFILRLPMLASVAQETGPPAVDKAVNSVRRRRILVADDNIDSVKSLELVLESLGNTVHTANDGLQALDAAEAFRPDVLLLDIGMPGLNGHEVCRRIRERPWGRNAVLVAMTGWGQEEDKRRSRDAGFDLHLVKPVNVDAIEKLLSSLTIENT